MPIDKSSVEELKAHVKELEQRLGEYESSNTEEDKKALTQYAQQTFVPATSSLIDRKQGSEEKSDSDSETVSQHLKAIGQHLKSEEGEFDLAMARLNNNALFNFLERLFS